MKNFTVEGVILQTTDFGDANRVVTLYTKQFGKLEVNAYGCRRSHNPLSGVIQMFNHVKAEIVHGIRVDNIRDADLVRHYDNLTTDIERLGYAALFFEIVNKMTLPKLPEPAIFYLLADSLPALNNRNPKIAALIAGCQFMQFSGIQMNFTNCVHCGKFIENDAAISLSDGGAICMNCIDTASDVAAYPEALRLTFTKMLSFDWQANTHLTFNSQQLNAAEEFFMNYIHFVIGKELNAEIFLRQIQPSA